MKSISEIRSFEDSFEVYHLPAVRIIGREVRNGGAIGNTAPALWTEVYASGDAEKLMALPQVLDDSMYGWTCEYDPETDTFIYIVCVMTPVGTPVPDGFVYRDIPETLCAKGLYGEDVPQTIRRAEDAGYATNWEPYGWNAELYLGEEEQNPPKPCATPWHWLVPVKKTVQE